MGHRGVSKILKIFPYHSKKPCVKILEQNKRSVEKMNSENAFKQLGQKLMNGEITPEEHVKEYNRLLKEMSEKYDSQWRPHEHI